LAQAQEATQHSVDIIERSIEAGATLGDNYAAASAKNLRTQLIENARIASLLAASTPARGTALAASSFRVPQLALTSDSGEAVERMATRIAAGTSELATEVRARQDLAEHLQQVDRQLLATSDLPSEQRNPSKESALRADLDSTSERLREADARLATAFPSFAELTSGKPIRSADIQTLLRPNEAMLVYLVDEDESWVWVLRPERSTLLHLTIGAKALSKEVRALRQRLDPSQNPLEQAFPATRAFHLYEKIMAPALPFLADVHQLFVVPDGPLQSLPFEVLVTRAPARDPDDTHPEENRGIAWLARDRAVTVLPSVASLRALRRYASRHHAARPFAGIGDPVLGGSNGTNGLRLIPRGLFRGFIANSDEVRSLPPLPETSEELHAIANILGAAESDLFLRERASEPVLRSAPLDQYRVVEFATHGLVAGQLALSEPALVLTPPNRATAENDGLLTASKIAGLSLNADWVILSACNTAADNGRADGGGLSGLARAFFYAGSRALLVSHWEVKSDAAVALTTGTFAEFQKDPRAGRAEAFRRAEMAVLDSPTLPPAFAHPMYWAPFTLIGDSIAGSQ
jgi:CHAT domain-containing protein